MLLSWPASGSYLALERATDLSASAWIKVTDKPVATNGVLVITNQTGRVRQFYRLRQP